MTTKEREKAIEAFLASHPSLPKRPDAEVIAEVKEHYQHQTPPGHAWRMPLDTQEYQRMLRRNRLESEGRKRFWKTTILTREDYKE